MKRTDEQRDDLLGSLMEIVAELVCRADWTDSPLRAKILDAAEQWDKAKGEEQP